MRKLLMLISLGMSLFATELVVKKAGVKISVNGNILQLSKNKKMTLTPGSSICFLDGKGKLIIDRRKQLTKKSKKCYLSPLPKSFKVSDFVDNLTSTAKVALVTGDLRIKNGVSTRGIKTSKTKYGNIEISKEQKEVIIFNKTYGPLPISLKIFDHDEYIVQEFVNEKNFVTLFRVPTNILRNNYNLVIINALDEELLNQSIVLKN